MKLKSSQFIAILLYALVMGVFWGTWFAQSRTMHLLGPATFLENGRMYIANLAMPMRFLMPGSILASFSVLLFIRDRKSAGFYGTFAAGVLMVVALVITLSVNVPIDNLIKTWTLQNLPSDWADIRNRWEVFHCLRTWVSIAGFSALVAGSLAKQD